MSTLADNRRARFEYEILETYEAGLKLTGQEVKSVKTGHIGVQGAYATVRAGEAWLLNAMIPPYAKAGILPEYDPRRTRKLLLKKTELRTLVGKVQAQGLTLVPLKVYTAHGLIKVALGLGRGRKKEDKREVIRKRETEREMARSLRSH